VWEIRRKDVGSFAIAVVIWALASMPGHISFDAQGRTSFVAVAFFAWVAAYIVRSTFLTRVPGVELLRFQLGACIVGQTIGSVLLSVLILSDPGSPPTWTLFGELFGSMGVLGVGVFFLKQLVLPVVVVLLFDRWAERASRDRAQA